MLSIQSALFSDTATSWWQRTRLLIQQQKRLSNDE